MSPYLPRHAWQPLPKHASVAVNSGHSRQAPTPDRPTNYTNNGHSEPRIGGRHPPNCRCATCPIAAAAAAYCCCCCHWRSACTHGSWSTASSLSINAGVAGRHAVALVLPFSLLPPPPLPMFANPSRLRPLIRHVSGPTSTVVPIPSHPLITL
jgi:hypothetical protein